MHWGIDSALGSCGAQSQRCSLASFETASLTPSRLLLLSLCVALQSGRGFHRKFTLHTAIAHREIACDGTTSAPGLAIFSSRTPPQAISLPFCFRTPVFAFPLLTSSSLSVLSSSFV